MSNAVAQEFPNPRPHVAVPAILPKPDGDPQAMLHMAAACTSAATNIRQNVSDGDKAAKGMQFTAPAALRIRNQVSWHVATQHQIAGDLDDLAGKLRRGADQLTQDWNDYGNSQRAHAKAISDNADIDEINRQNAHLLKKGH